MVGWLSTFFLAICGLPQARKAYKEGHARGLSNGFLFCWTTGEILLIAHTYMVHDWPVFWNAAANLLVMGFILRYKFWPRSSPPHFCDRCGEWVWFLTLRGRKYLCDKCHD